MGADAFQRDTQGRAPQAEVIEPGFKYNLPDMNAVLGLSQLTRITEMNRKRAALAARYATGEASAASMSSGASSSSPAIFSISHWRVCGPVQGL